MTSSATRLAFLALVAAGSMSFAATTSTAPSIKQPDKLVILSNSDLKGKTSPCGCHIPKGGLSRRSSFGDSTKSEYGQVALVDNGGFFPEVDSQQDIAWFLMDALKTLNVDAVGTSEKELRFGVAYLKGEVKRTGLPMTSANLLNAKTGTPLLAPSIVKTIGNVKVGFFSLMSDKVELGPARDSLRVEEPSAAARRTIAALKKQGATVIVFLSQLGKVESEDLVAAIPGVDAVIMAKTPMVQKGRMIKNTVAIYGGEQGHYIGRTILTLGAGRTVATGEADAITLGPEISEQPEILKLVKDFEFAFNEKQRKLDKERAAAAQQSSLGSQGGDHFVGAEVCARCHQDETEQWKTTSHSVAWQTLIDVKKDATPDCIPCHVVGFKQAGGFQAQSDVAKLANVQCENCHGMGTKHESFSNGAHQVTQDACIKCHQGENDPEFNWERKLPLIAHNNTSGSTIAKKKIKDGKGDASHMMGTHGKP